MLSSKRVREYNPHYQQWGMSINHHDRTPPNKRLISQTKPGDSCYYAGKRDQIKRIGYKVATLVDISEYIKNGLDGAHGLPIPRGFNVKTSGIYNIRFNHWHA